MKESCTSQIHKTTQEAELATVSSPPSSFSRHCVKVHKEKQVHFRPRDVGEFPPLGIFLIQLNKALSNLL